jgi:hypothetical protein
LVLITHHNDRIIQRRLLHLKDIGHDGIQPAIDLVYAMK